MRIERLREYSIEEIINISGIITEIERYSIYDGPGIRTIVFTKGCPLRCLWCCNPETQKHYIEVAFYQTKCIKCNRCIDICGYNALTLSNSKILLNRKICLKNCFNQKEKFPCTSECYVKALEVIGKSMTVSEVFNEIIKDYSIYERTGGGVTISGGEPMAQPEFVYSLLLYCKKNWMSTALETCGYGQIEDYKNIVNFIDVIFIDLKSLDAEKHKRWTRVDNIRILEVLQYLSSLALKKDFTLYVRVPVIPGFNDSEEDIKEIGLFVKNKCVGVGGVELLPYHKLGSSKYKALGRKYKLVSLEPPPKNKIDKLNKILTNIGIKIIHFP